MNHICSRLCSEQTPIYLGFFHSKFVVPSDKDNMLCYYWLKLKKESFRCDHMNISFIHIGSNCFKNGFIELQVDVVYFITYQTF